MNGQKWCHSNCENVLPHTKMAGRDKNDRTNSRTFCQQNRIAFSPVQLVEPTKIIEEIMHLELYIEAKVQARGSRGNLTEPAVYFGTKSAARSALIDSDSVHSAAHPTEGWAHQWVPPASVQEDYDDYHEVLREDGSL